MAACKRCRWPIQWQKIRGKWHPFMDGASHMRSCSVGECGSCGKAVQFRDGRAWSGGDLHEMVCGKPLEIPEMEIRTPRKRRLSGEVLERAKQMAGLVGWSD